MEARLFRGSFWALENNKRYFCQLDGEWIRYELVVIAKLINTGYSNDYISHETSAEFANILNMHHSKTNTLILDWIDSFWERTSSDLVVFDDKKERGFSYLLDAIALSIVFTIMWFSLINYQLPDLNGASRPFLCGNYSLFTYIFHVLLNYLAL